MQNSRFSHKRGETWVRRVLPVIRACVPGIYLSYSCDITQGLAIGMNFASSSYDT